MLADIYAAIHKLRPWIFPMQNRFKELHSLFNVVIPVGLPGVLIDSKRFAEEIATPLQYGQKKDALPHQLAKVTWSNLSTLLGVAADLSSPSITIYSAIFPQHEPAT